MSDLECSGRGLTRFDLPGRIDPELVFKVRHDGETNCHCLVASPPPGSR
jgi:hypothetical protein